MKRIDWLVLKEIAASEAGLQAFTLHRRLCFDVQALSSSLGRLVETGFAEMSDGQARVTRQGLNFFLAGAINERSERGLNPSVAEDFIGWECDEVLSINHPYVPRQDLM